MTQGSVRIRLPRICAEGFPVVWIFDEVPDKWGTPHWSTYFEPADWLADSSGDPAAFRRLLRAPGEGLLDLVTYERPAPNAEPKLDKTEIGHNILSGLVVFSPIFPTYRQTVCWYQATGASRNPVAWCWGAADWESTVHCHSLVIKNHSPSSH